MGDRAMVKVKKQNDMVVKVADEQIIARLLSYVQNKKLESQAKKQADQDKAEALPFCLTTWLAEYAKTEERPPLLKFLASRKVGDQTEESQVTYVLNDNGGKYELTAEQIKAIKASAGISDDQKDESGVFQQVTVTEISQEVFARPEVAEAMNRLVKRLVKAGTVTPEEGDQMFRQHTGTTVNKGLLDRLAVLCSGNLGRMTDFFTALDRNVGQSFRC